MVELKVGDKVKVVLASEVWDGVEGTVKEAKLGPLSGTPMVSIEITKEINKHFPVGSSATLYQENLELIEEPEINVGDTIRVVGDNSHWFGVEGVVLEIYSEFGIPTVKFRITKDNPKNELYSIGDKASAYLTTVELIKPDKITFAEIQKGDTLRITDEVNSALDVRMVVEGVADRKRKTAIKFQGDDYAWVTDKGYPLIDGIRASHDNVTIELLDRPKRSAIDNMPVGTVLAVRVDNEASIWDIYTKVDDNTWHTVHTNLWQGSLSKIRSDLFSEFAIKKAWKTIYRPNDK